MPSPLPSHSNAQTPEIAMASSQNQKPKTEEEKGQEDEEEEDDADFNPLGQETLSPEASSSLSSEAEPDAIPAPISIPTPISHSPQSKGDSPSNPFIRSGNVEEEEETVMQSNIEIRVSQEESLGQAAGTAEERRNGDEEEGDVAEDAICRRTRARYSLANFTLDELETFLQETDDEDDLANVDDEEEYRKFLAAVLQGNDGGGGEAGAGGSGDGAGKGDDDDDDEENDADFEVEIEEALMESDGDEGDKGKGRREGSDGGRSEPRRPETRQKKRQKDSSVESGRKLLGRANIPLRPLLPSNGNERPPRLLPESALHRPPSLPQLGQLGFTASQIGQLHCLIHEHVQLLVQVYTLCVFDSSRQHIGSDAQRMLLELVRKRDESLAWRKDPHPGFCFRPPFVQPSVSEEYPRLCSLCSSDAADVQRDRSGMNTASCNTTDRQQARETTAQSGNRNFHGANVGSCPHSEDSIWKPVVRGPLKTVLDVAPLSLVSRYVTDVSAAIQEFNQRRAGSSYGASHFVKEPLFPFPLITIPSTETNSEVARGPVPMGLNLNMDPSRSTGPVQHQPKKSLATTLVESTKKQSVALVPREIVKLAQRFFPLFNSSLFPHKPPQPAVANRVLFTDAEDGLLAMGLMEYNNDWKAIQQRFLPCKSKHQIFVRQKNRSSSKAPENPIKASRRSPPHSLKPMETLSSTAMHHCCGFDKSA